MPDRFTCIMKLADDNRVAKYIDFDTQAEADAHIAKYSSGYPDAFVVTDEPARDPTDWVCDPSSKTIASRSKRPRPMKDWSIAMAATDAGMPRAVEDVIDALDESTQAKLPQIIKDNHAAKKVLRGQKP